MRIVDAHLDLSSNALSGRDVLRPAAEQVAARGSCIPTVGLPDLRRGGVGLVCATVFCAPAYDGRAGYRTADEAHAVAQRHLDWYRAQTDAGRFRFVRSPADLDAADTGAQAAILLMEGADPLRTEADVIAWHAAGLRIVGLAWRGTRHAGGTDCPGPLTATGIAMVNHLDRLGIIHDASHLAERSFWDLLEVSGGPVMASHSNCRSVVPTDRQLSDEMARALFARGGVVGVNFFDKFLLPPAEYGKRRATLADVVVHVKHLCELAGHTSAVGLGTDMDGGLGRNEIPVEITTSGDLPRVADALSSAGFGDAAVAGIMGENWVRFFRQHLPG